MERKFEVHTRTRIKNKKNCELIPTIIDASILESNQFLQENEIVFSIFKIE